MASEFDRIKRSFGAALREGDCKRAKFLHGQLDAKARTTVQRKHVSNSRARVRACATKRDERGRFQRKSPGPKVMVPRKSAQATPNPKTLCPEPEPIIVVQPCKTVWQRVVGWFNPNVSGKVRGRVMSVEEAIAHAYK